MRAFSDDAGRTWDVVAGRESWGAIFAIFIPRPPPSGGWGGDEPPQVRQAPLRAAGYAEANDELQALSDDELRSLLHRSAPKETG